VSSVLVLNASYEPLHITSLRRAVVLLLKEKAELVEAAEARLRAEQVSFPVPLVIRLLKYVPLPHSLSRGPTRRWILARDNYQCQYCGMVPPRNDLTLDHVVPRSQGGQHTWENLVACCRRCNSRKGGRSPQEANLTLLRRPFRPRYAALVAFAEAGTPEVWRKYLDFDTSLAA